MATNPPDPHPDSPPQGPDEAPDQLTPASEPGRESIEDVPEVEEPDSLECETPDRSSLDPPGASSGTAGTGGENKVQDGEFER